MSLTDNEKAVIRLLAEHDLGFTELMKGSGLSPRGLSIVLDGLKGKKIVSKGKGKRGSYGIIKPQFATETLFRNAAADFITRRDTYEAPIHARANFGTKAELDMGVAAEMLTEAPEDRPPSPVQAAFQAEEWREMVHDIVDIQRRFFYAWFNSRVEKDSRAKTALKFIGALTVYLRGIERKRGSHQLKARSPGGLPRTWSEVIPYTPKLDHYLKIPESEEGGIEAVIANAIEFEIARRATVGRIPGLQTYTEDVLHNAFELETPEVKSARLILEDKTMRKAFEGFIADCIPPKTLLVIPISGFEDTSATAGDVARALGVIKD